MLAGRSTVLRLVDGYCHTRHGLFCPAYWPYCSCCVDNIDGFTITPRRSSRYPAVQIGALVYADDIAITCDTIEQAQNVF